jgi:hypothetical protein
MRSFISSITTFQYFFFWEINKNWWQFPLTPEHTIAIVICLNYVIGVFYSYLGRVTHFLDGGELTSFYQIFASLVQAVYLTFSSLALIRSIGLWFWYMNITITILDIIHHWVFYLKHNVSEIGPCPCLQVGSTWVGSTWLRSTWRWRQNPICERWCFK